MVPPSYILNWLPFRNQQILLFSGLGLSEMLKIIQILLVTLCCAYFRPQAGIMNIAAPKEFLSECFSLSEETQP